MARNKGRSRRSIQHLFDSSGRWIAFRKAQYVFDTSGRWIGWLPWGDDDVVDVQGTYLGTIFPGNRLYRVLTQRYRGYPGYPGYPGSPGHPGYPSFAGHSRLPPATADLQELRQA